MINWTTPIESLWQILRSTELSTGYMIRYNDTPDPKAKYGYRRKIQQPAGKGGIFELTEKQRLFSGEYTIEPEVWIGFRFTSQDNAVIDDVSLCLEENPKP